MLLLHQAIIQSYVKIVDISSVEFCGTHLICKTNFTRSAQDISVLFGKCLGIILTHKIPIISHPHMGTIECLMNILENVDSDITK